MSLQNFESRTRFEYFPTEIILLIFDYLSSNDIIYTFFFLNQRFNNLLIQNKRYLNHLEFPINNSDIWKTIFPIINSQIESINLNTINLHFSLEYFSNLKSITIKSPLHISYNQLESIFKSEQFKNLHSFKLKDYEYLFDQSLYKYSIHPESIFEKVFNNNNSLEIFQYSLKLPSFIYLIPINFQTNLHLHSLTLKLSNFTDIFTLISYTPYLEYLNVQSHPCYTRNEPINKINIKLKTLYLKLNYYESKYHSYYDEHILFNDINMFASSLICLSLDLVNASSSKSTDKFMFNSLKLQQMLEPMIKLKQFYFYIKHSGYKMNSEYILDEFKNQFWFDHNCFFGIHRDYFYTLPFHFDYLYEFYGNFYDVNTSNPYILTDNCQLWNYVKYIDLSTLSKYDQNFMKELKIKMPNLIFINFIHFDNNQNISLKNIEKDIKYVKLNNIKRIKCTLETFEYLKQWIINTLPNITQLILNGKEYPLINDTLTQILCKTIQRLDLNVPLELNRLTQINYIYLLNLQHITIKLNYQWKKPVEYAKFIMKLMNVFQNLDTLLIYNDGIGGCATYYNEGTLIHQITQYLDINQINKIYQIIKSYQYLSFFKREYDYDENFLTNEIVSTYKKQSSFISKITFSNRK